MVGQLRKALSRPTQLWALARQYLLFALTRQLSRWVLTPQNGIFLGENARVQRLACLSAERPGASIRVGRDCIFYEHARIQAYGQGTVEIGEGSIIGDARIYARESVRLGRRVVTSWNVFVQDFDPHPVEPELRAVQMIRMARGFKPAYRAVGPLPALEWSFPSKAISIGDDVWLGANVTVLKGARIGDGCVVATGSVVTAGDYPPRSVLGGVPAKVIATLAAPAGAAARAAALVAALSAEAEDEAEAGRGATPMPAGLTRVATLGALSPQSAEAAKVWP